MLTTAQYIVFLNGDGRQLSPPDILAYQNYFIGESRSWNGFSYKFAPFVLSGSLSAAGEESSQAEIVAPAALITGSLFGEAVEKRFLVKIETLMLLGVAPGSPEGIPSWTEQSTLSEAFWICSSMGYTSQVPGEEESPSLLTLTLDNPLNAVNGQAPTLRLSSRQVGSLPASGNISL